MRVGLYLKLLPLYVGLSILAVSPFYLAHRHAGVVRQVAAVAQVRLDQPVKPVAISGKPVRIIMPDLAIDVPVIDGYYIPAKKIWYVAPAAGTYATNTYPINNSAGVTLIYGHWFNYVFGNTKDIKPGDTALVYTDNNHVFQYVFDNEVSVSPTDVDLFSNLGGKPTLKVMTCGGAWAQNRRVMTFRLIKAT